MLRRATKATRRSKTHLRTAFVYPTWNASDKTTNITLSNGNLTAAAGTGQNLVRATAGRTSGRWYWEVTMPATAASGFEPGFGVARSTATASGLWSNGALGALLFGNGSVYLNTSNMGAFTGAIPANAVVSIALDMDAKRIWYRINAGNWNGNGTHDPANNIGGFDLTAALGGLPAYPFFLTNGSAYTVVANFGATAFAQSVPTGFSAQGGTVAPPKSWYVDNAATGTGDGTSWANAWTSPNSVVWSSVSPGDTVYVSGGTTSKTYSNAMMTVGASGTASKPIYIKRGIDAGHTGEPIFDGNNSTTQNYDGVVIDGKDHIQVSGLAASGHFWTCFRAYNCTAGVVFDNCRAFQTDFANATIYPRGYDFRNNMTSGGAGTWAVILRNSSTDSVASTICQTDGIYTQNNNGVLIENNTIICRNGDTTGHSDGVQSQEDIALTIRNNLFSHPNGGGDNHGLWIQNTATGGTVTIYNNVVARPTTNPSFGISQNRVAAAGTGFDGKALIYNNTIYNGNSCIEIADGPDSEVKNNILYCTSGFVGMRFRGTSLPAAGQINNNLIYGPSSTIAEISSANKTWAQYQALGYDAAGVNADPLFTNAGTSDFTTQSGSPARNAGQTIALVSTDKNGTSRPQGAAYDIGAYEAA